jgi:NADH-quinone oxidoreductase subunit A
MLEQYLGIVMLFGVAAVLCGAFVIASWFFGPKKNAPYKSAPYECGVTPVGDARERFPIKFYLVAIVFILFDIEVVFLWSWMTVFRGSDRDFMLFTFIEFLTYMATWVIGYMYAIRVGAINWDDSAILDPSHEFDANPDEQTMTATPSGTLSGAAL